MDTGIPGFILEKIEEHDKQKNEKIVPLAFAKPNDSLQDKSDTCHAGGTKKDRQSKWKGPER